MRFLAGLGSSILLPLIRVIHVAGGGGNTYQKHSPPAVQRASLNFYNCPDARARRALGMHVSLPVCYLNHPPPHTCGAPGGGNTSRTRIETQAAGLARSRGARVGTTITNNIRCRAGGRAAPHRAARRARACRVAGKAFANHTMCGF